jgi:hypothetical protein
MSQRFPQERSLLNRCTSRELTLKIETPEPLSQKQTIFLTQDCSSEGKMRVWVGSVGRDGFASGGIVVLLADSVRILAS